MGYQDGRNQYSNQEQIPKPVEVPEFYQNGTKTVREDLFDEIARQIAESLRGKDKRGNETGVSITSLRRIFDEVKRFKQLLSTEDDFAMQLPYIRMVKSKVAYTVARAGKDKKEAKKLYDNLKHFIESGIDRIKNKKDYEVFVSLFEAVYGFYYERAPENKNNLQGGM